MTDKATCTRASGFEAYTVRAGYEWATIVLRGWQATGIDGQPREIGEILIHSSYGTWAYQWGHLGSPFKRWLTKAECSYVAEKFMGSNAYKFDGKKTVRELRRDLLAHRKLGDITKNDARSIWDWIEANENELGNSGHDFVRRMCECKAEAEWKDDPSPGTWYSSPGRGARYFLAEPWERLSTSLDVQFVGFWRVIWPVFCEHLRQELAKEAA